MLKKYQFDRIRNLEGEFAESNLEENTAKLCPLGNPLEKLLKVVDFEMFRETLEAGLYKEKLSNVGAKPYDYVLIRIEHVFGYCEQSMRGMFSRAVGFARNAARNVLTSLVYNMMRYEQIQRLGMN